MASATRQRLVEASVRRFYRDGFRNVGIDQVLSDVGISKTAFYKHFECKEDLVLAALDSQHEFLQSRFQERVRALGSVHPSGPLIALFDVVEEILAEEDYRGCIFINVAIEFPLPHEPAHQAAARSKQAIQAFVEDLAREAGAADPVSLAQELCLIMEGAYVTRQVTGNAHTIDIARRAAQRAIQDHCSRRSQAS